MLYRQRQISEYIYIKIDTHRGKKRINVARRPPSLTRGIYTATVLKYSIQVILGFCRHIMKAEKRRMYISLVHCSVNQLLKFQPAPKSKRLAVLPSQPTTFDIFLQNQHQNQKRLVCLFIQRTLGYYKFRYKF